MEYIGRIEKDKKLYMNENEIVIFGAGKELPKLLDKLKATQVKSKVICVCDNNLDKQGKEVEGIKIICPDHAFKHYNNAIYIVYNRFYVDIIKQLMSQGIERIHLIRN